MKAVLLLMAGLLLGSINSAAAADPQHHVSQQHVSQQHVSQQHVAQQHFERGRSLLESRTPEDAELALTELRKALDAFSLLDNPAGVAESLYALALASDYAGDRDAALQLDRRAVMAFERLGDAHGSAATHDHWGSVLAARGDLSAALEHFTAALKQRQEQRRSETSSPEMAASLHNLASLHLEAGHGGEALDYFQQTLELHRHLDQSQPRAATLNNMGLLWLHLGRLESSQKALEAALDLHRSNGDLRLQAGTLNNLGWIAWTQHLYPQTRRHLSSALEIYRQLQDSVGTAEALGNLGLVDLEQGKLEDARRRIEAAIYIAQQHGLQGIEASHLGSLGRLFLAQDRLDPAITTLTDAAARQHRLGVLEGRTITLFDLARAHLRGGDSRAAEAAINNAIRIVETMGSRLGAGDPRAYFLAPRRHLYDFRIDLLMDRGDVEAALQTAEQARAQGLLDLLRWTRQSPDKTSVQHSPAELDALRSLLGADTEVLLYHVGSSRSWAWILTAETLAGIPLGASSKLESQARDAHEKLSQSRQRSRRGLARRALERLAETVLEPLGPRHPQRLVIVPDGALHRIPFGALSTPDGRSLLDRHELVYLPSLAVLAELRNRSKKRGSESFRGELAVLADPIFALDDQRIVNPTLPPPSQRPASQAPRAQTTATLARLPFSAIEAKRIAGFFPAEATRFETGSGASRQILLNGELDGYRRLHFATHAVIDDQRPERSGLAFSAYDAHGRAQEGFLRLPDLFELSLNVDLVTLSACRSALGKPLRGEGLVGLSRGFFFAGARRLVVSLWDVDDRAAAELMEAFYRSMVKDSLDPAAALASAQQQLRQDPRWSSPFYWAGFILIGDWK